MTRETKVVSATATETLSALVGEASEAMEGVVEDVATEREGVGWVDVAVDATGKDGS